MIKIRIEVITPGETSAVAEFSSSDSPSLWLVGHLTGRAINAVQHCLQIGDGFSDLQDGLTESLPGELLPQQDNRVAE